MLKKITVKNYKGFKDEMVLDFSDFKEYKFNLPAIKNKLIKSAIIYGKNGAGKSNFGLALFDLTLHLVDKQRNDIQLSNYLNGDSDEEEASFSYDFIIDTFFYKYEYRKTDSETLTYETLTINDEKVFSYNFLSHKGDFSGLKIINAENLKIDESINISVLRYIAFNANISDQNPIAILMKFVNNMLWFRTATDGNKYIGFKKGSGSLISAIIEEGKVKEFEEYLRENEVNYRLEAKKSPVGNDVLVAKYKFKDYDFLETASHGTKALLLYFYWIQRLNNASFVFIDEFDAFFHTFLAKDLFKNITQKINSQMIITTHNTSLMSNDILRPDCYFILSEGKISSLPNCTERELREGHNLEKMFKGGEFNVK
ncbi:MAG: AAA family ATPase [Acholeplasma sp.]|nr:AAA family ATPase [Acholeplasma sp.]